MNAAIYFCRILGIASRPREQIALASRVVEIETPTPNSRYFAMLRTFYRSTRHIGGNDDLVQAGWEKDVVLARI